jgi:hypothetical protein
MAARPVPIRFKMMATGLRPGAARTRVPAVFKWRQEQQPKGKKPYNSFINAKH